MFLYEGDCWKKTTVIRGIQYTTVSHYSGNRDIFEKMGELILGSFWSSEGDEITEESSLVSGIDKKSD